MLNSNVDPLNRHLNRRRFLQRTSLGVTGLVVLSDFSCSLAAENAGLLDSPWWGRAYILALEPFTRQAIGKSVRLPGATPR